MLVRRPRLFLLLLLGLALPLLNGLLLLLLGGCYTRTLWTFQRCVYMALSVVFEHLYPTTHRLTSIH